MVKQQMNLVEIEAMNSLQELTLEELDNVLGAGGGVIQIHFIQKNNGNSDSPIRYCELC
jgi:sboA